MNNAEKYMSVALDEAKKALLHNDVPVGCVVVHAGTIIAISHNQIEQNKDRTSHAELLAIRQAQEKVGYKHLVECDMYVTLEPCPMCAGAIVLSRINNLHIATKDPKSGACGSVMNIASNEKLNHRCKLHFGTYENKSSQLLKDFFKQLRQKNGRRS